MLVQAQDRTVLKHFLAMTHLSGHEVDVHVQHMGCHETTISFVAQHRSIKVPCFAEQALHSSRRCCRLFRLTYTQATMNVVS
jgi:hypothetical protein